MVILQPERPEFAGDNIGDNPGLHRDILLLLRVIERHGKGVKLTLSIINGIRFLSIVNTLIIN